MNNNLTIYTNRFQKLFSDANKKVFIPFFMLGDPTPAASLRFIKTAIRAGANALEIGMPFSDPIADGPTIQASAARALAAGTNFNICLDLLRQIRAITDIPIGMLLYYNLLHKRGISVAHRELKAAGVDAILAADLPLEEASEHEGSLQNNELGNIQLIAPNTPLARAKLLLEHTTAFAYIITAHGTTGVRDSIPDSTFERIKALRLLSNKPLVMGFGISQGEQIKALHAAGANGAIIGSALTRIIAKHGDDVEAADKELFEFLQGVVGKL